MVAIIKKTKPTSPGRRFVEKLINTDLHKGDPYYPLLTAKRRNSGRNNMGRITMRHIGGGHKRALRLIDFKRNKDNIPGIVERLEYDPNRTANIALVLYKDGERRYILAANGLQAGSEVMSGEHAPIKPGNTLPLSAIPIGITIHCIEMNPGQGAKLARSAGNSAQLIARESGYATVILSSGEMRKILITCRATIGEVGNEKHNLIKLGKAGATRHRGIRPTVRGVAMNPVDHPHGGGEGRTAAGRHPVSPWGTLTKGYKTRKNKRTSSMIVRRRREKK